MMDHRNWPSGLAQELTAPRGVQAVNRGCLYLTGRKFTIRQGRVTALVRPQISHRACGDPRLQSPPVATVT